MTSSPDAAELVARLLATYASATFYSDTGAARFSDGQPHLSFQTRFVRGRRFRFEHRSWSGPYVVWSDGVDTLTHWSVRGQQGGPEIVDDGPDLGIAIAAATGVSDGTAHNVPSLLLPMTVGAGSITLAQLADVQLVAIEDVDGHPCARVTGSTRTQPSLTVWIDRGTSLLRRITWDAGSPGERTALYEPSLAPIDVASIERPGIEGTPAQPRPPVPRTGFRFAAHTMRVEQVEPEGPALRAGLLVDDVIEGVNGKKTDALTLYRQVKIGEALRLTVRRDGTSVEMLVAVEAATMEPTPGRPLED